MSTDRLDGLFAEWLTQYFGKHWPDALKPMELEDLKRAYRAGHIDAHTEIRLEKEHAHEDDV
jgi:hypothetical protein